MTYLTPDFTQNWRSAFSALHLLDAKRKRCGSDCRQSFRTAATAREIDDISISSNGRPRKDLPRIPARRYLELSGQPHAHVIDLHLHWRYRRFVVPPNPEFADFGMPSVATAIARLAAGHCRPHINHILPITQSSILRPGIGVYDGKTSPVKAIRLR
jgi:hypothetical protein